MLNRMNNYPEIAQSPESQVVQQIRTQLLELASTRQDISEIKEGLVAQGYQQNLIEGVLQIMLKDEVVRLVDAGNSVNATLHPAKNHPQTIAASKVDHSR